MNNEWSRHKPDNFFAFGTVEIQDFPVDLTNFMAMTLSSSPIEERDSDCMKDWKNWFK